MKKGIVSLFVMVFMGANVFAECSNGISVDRIIHVDIHAEHDPEWEKSSCVELTGEATFCFARGENVLGFTDSCRGFTGALADMPQDCRLFLTTSNEASPTCECDKQGCYDEREP